jgi:hypothetical protein
MLLHRATAALAGRGLKPSVELALIAGHEWVGRRRRVLEQPASIPFPLIYKWRCPSALLHGPVSIFLHRSPPLDAIERKNGKWEMGARTGWPPR